jgi:hypothetical protein
MDAMASMDPRHSRALRLMAPFPQRVRDEERFVHLLSVNLSRKLLLRTLTDICLPHLVACCASFAQN